MPFNSVKNLMCLFMDSRRFGMYIILLFSYLNLITLAEQNSCPKKCTCKTISQLNDSKWLKLRCGDLEKISFLDELDLMNIANEILQLNLSNNFLTEFIPKVQLVALQKLDLSHNKISMLYDHQFDELPNLKRLDVSNNNLKRIELLAFSSLIHVERLKLCHNQLAIIEQNTLEPLKSLKHFDISENPLNCDCALLRSLQWLDLKAVKLLPNPKCHNPSLFRGVFLRKIRLDIDISCNSSTTADPPSTVTLEPGGSGGHVAVLEGGQFTLHCKRAPPATGSSSAAAAEDVQWTWLDSDPTRAFTDLTVEEGSVVIPRVRRAHAGVWRCAMVGGRGGEVPTEAHTRLLVIGACPATSTHRPGKGALHWPPAPPNTLARLPCATHAHATWFCNGSTASWDMATPPDTEACDWLSERTRVLQQFARLNVSGRDVRFGADTLRHLANYTAQVVAGGWRSWDGGASIMDLVFSVQTIEKFGKNLDADSELAGPLLDIINGLLELSAQLFADAQLEDGSCQKLLDVLHRITTVAPSSTLHKTNFAMETFAIKPESFAGLTCNWWQPQSTISDNVNQLSPARALHCTAHSTTTSANSNATTTPSNQSSSNSVARQLVASIQVPPSLFHQLHQFGVLSSSHVARVANVTSNSVAVQKIRVEMFSSGVLFPWKPEVTSENVTVGFRDEITSPVLRFTIDNVNVDSLTEPVYVMLSISQPREDCITPPRPVWLNNASHWSSQGCHTLRHHRTTNHGSSTLLLVFQCRQLGVYALMQTCAIVENSPEHGDSSSRDDDRGYVQDGHVDVLLLVGGVVLEVGLVIVVLTYVRCQGVRRTDPIRTRHALVNSWIALGLLMLVFTVGGRRTAHRPICAAVGVTLHYLTLCVLLWASMGVDALYKRLRRRINMLRIGGDCSLGDTSLPNPTTTTPLSPQPMPPPLLDMYLVGWGVGGLLCGLTAASVNISEYGRHNYCFLPLEGAARMIAGALYVPYAAILAAIAVQSILVRAGCKELGKLGLTGGVGGGGRGSVGQPGRSSVGDTGTQATEQLDLDLLEPPEPTTLLHSTSTSTSTSSSSSSSTSSNSSSCILDNHTEPSHSYLRQLRTSAIYLLLVVLLVVSAGGTLNLPRPLDLWTSPTPPTLTALYAALCVLLAAFLLGVYCIASQEGRTYWSKVLSRSPRHSHTVFTTIATATGTSLRPLPTTTSSAHSHTPTPTSNKYTNTTPPPPPPPPPPPAAVNNEPVNKINNIDRQQQHHLPLTSSMPVNIIENCTQSAEMFYNPHQSFVARRFFRKQKQQRHLHKRNNMLIMRQRAAAADIAENTSKVNNTNIHTENERGGVGGVVVMGNGEVGVVGAAGRGARGRRRNLNVLGDSGGEDESNTDQVRRRGGGGGGHANNDRHHRHKKRENIPPPTIAAHDLIAHDPAHMMRTVSQQCTLKYSSDSISLGGGMGANCLLDDSLEDGGGKVQALEPTYCNVLEMHKQINCQMKGDGNSPKEGRLYVNPVHALVYGDKDCSITAQANPPTSTDGHAYVQHDMGVGVGASALSCSSSVCPSELDELYQQIRGVGVRHCRSHSLLPPLHLHTHPDAHCQSDSEVNCHRGNQSQQQHWLALKDETRV